MVLGELFLLCFKCSSGDLSLCIELGGRKYCCFTDIIQHERGAILCGCLIPVALGPEGEGDNPRQVSRPYCSLVFNDLVDI